MIKYIAILSLLVLNIEANAGWHLKKDKDDIRIYTRNVDGSSFLEFKAIMEVNNVNLKEVLEVILDVENYDRLVRQLLLLRGRQHQTV